MLQLKFGNEILLSYQRLPYKAWYAIAEFIDNSTQAYINQKEILDDQYSREQTNLTVDIRYDDSNGRGHEVLTISDNSIGMDENDLERALVIGLPPNSINGRSRYGLGMKTAAFWFGKAWSIRTKKLGSSKEIYVELNLNEIVHSNDNKLNPQITQNGRTDEHYTIIKITDLNKKLTPSIRRNIEEYLQSIYRFDFKNLSLILLFQGDKLTWDSSAIDNRLIKDANNIPIKRNFNFDVNGKQVTGWAGVFESGSRKDAGFSIIQANRIIRGWPNAWKPEEIYGYQEGGSNNLISQRLVGELTLEGFHVSHTKDSILFVDDEEDILQEKLINQIGDLIHTAVTYKKYEAVENVTSIIQITSAVNDVLGEINSQSFSNIIGEADMLPDEVIISANSMVVQTVKEKVEPTIDATIGELRVIVYLNNETSSYEPYLITKSTSNQDEVVIIINKLHPHWYQLQSQEQIYNYIRHCVYDGVSEWKAWFVNRTLNPETIKNIKDKLLRIPFDLEQATTR